MKRSYNGYNLICLSENDARRMMEEIHEGVCGPHMNGHMLAKKIIRQDTIGQPWKRIVANTSGNVTNARSMQI